MVDADDLVMQALREGRTEGLRELVDRHGPVVLNFLYRMTGDRALAEDLSQETFLRVYRHASGYVPGGGFRAWLFAIARNLAFKESRRRAPPPLPSPAGPAPADAARQVELQAAVSAALDRIEEPFRSVLVLCSVDGVSYKEAASACGCSVKTISSRLARARARLRELLAPHLREDSP